MQRLDDLPADRQAKAGMLAELFAVRPFRVKPVEDVFQVGFRNPWPLILDADFRPTDPASFTRTRMRPLGGLKECALPIRLRSTCTSRSSTASTCMPAGGAMTSSPGSLSGSRVASSSSLRVRTIGTTSTGRAVTRDISASTREASLTSLISRSSRITS